MCFQPIKRISTAEEILKFLTKKALVSSFILTSFDYCPLVWFVSSAKSLKKVENLQKCACALQ